MAYKYIDLFCGAGGLSLGFDNAGFDNVFSVEFNPDFARTYKRNFPTHNLVIDDVRNVDNKEIRKLVGDEEVDVIIGGPPCQGFSIAGNIGRTFIDDERNSLYLNGLLRPHPTICQNGAVSGRLSGMLRELCEADLSQPLYHSGCQRSAIAFRPDHQTRFVEVSDERHPDLRSW